MKKINKLENYTDDSDNSIIVHGETTKNSFSNSLIIFKENNSKIIIGTNSNLSCCNIELGRNSTLKIGNNCHIRGKISIGLNSTIDIGNYVRATSNLKMRAVESTDIIIEDDCLIATNVHIRTNDGHPIYDTNTKKRINHSESVLIKEHVWIGDEALILKGSIINEACIVAARSVVTGEIPRNSVCAGTPAKVIRNDVTWEHDTKSHTERFYK